MSNVRARTSGRIVILAGPSCTGKTTLSRLLAPALGGEHFKTLTSRRDRGTAEDRADHRFVSPDQFDSMRSSGDILFCDFLFDNWYGMHRNIRDLSIRCPQVVSVPSWRARDLLELFPGSPAFHFVAPEAATLRRRLEERSVHSRAEMDARIADAERQNATYVDDAARVLPAPLDHQFSQIVDSIAARWR